MLVLLPFLTILGFADAERAHIDTGTAFLALTGNHIYDRRNRLFKRAAFARCSPIS